MGTLISKAPVYDMGNKTLLGHLLTYEVEIMGTLCRYCEYEPLPRQPIEPFTGLFIFNN